MKKRLILWFAAVALTLSAGTGLAASFDSGGMHGQGGGTHHQGGGTHQQGFDRHGLERHGFEQHHDGFNRFHRFDRHSRVIIIGSPFFGEPIYYTPPQYLEQYPPTYLVPSVNYSYYCTDPSGYYPEIQNCPSGWLRVVPDYPID